MTSHDPATPDDLIAKWSSAAEDMRRLQAQVCGAVIVEEFLGDLQRLRSGDKAEVLTIAQAAAASGYSAAHLARLVRAGKLISLRPPGSRGWLTFRRGDLPRKPAHGHTTRAGVHDLASRLYRGKEARHGRS